jgi:hypothetical protein
LTTLVVAALASFNALYETGRSVGGTLQLD